MPDAAPVTEPLEVTEQWEILEGTPLREMVTAYGVYPPGEGARAVLPAAVQDSTRVDVFVVGTGESLTATRGTRGWEVAIPTSARPLVRIGARVEREVHAVRALRVRWPDAPAASASTRRMLDVPRAWILAGSDDWTCPDDDAPMATCVTSARMPAPLQLRVHARGPTPWGLVVVLLLAAFCSWAALWLCAPTDRVPARPGTVRPVHRMAVGVALGLVVSACVALALGATLRVRWITALGLAAMVGPWVGALAVRTPLSRALSAIALLVVPAVCLLHGGFVSVLVSALVALGVVMLAAWRGPVNDHDRDRDHEDARATAGVSSPP